MDFDILVVGFLFSSFKATNIKRKRHSGAGTAYPSGAPEFTPGF
jgi:hypothetical protein